MEDTKKRERSAAKGGDESGAESSSGTVPKKRGRPANPDKVQKAPPTGRGRGRPAKNAGSVKKVAVDSDDEGAVTNGGGDAPSGGGRGRPPKGGKSKTTAPIKATGKGRGRPKNPPKSDQDDDDADDDGNDDDEDDGQSSDYKAGSAKKSKKSAAKTPKKSAGRPRKIVVSEDEEDDASDNDDDDDAPRPLGRPSTGAVKLNIVATGRGQGRPKKGAASKRSTEDNENGSSAAVPKKRGRPSTKKGGAYVPTGKPAGRPKANAAAAAASDGDGDDSFDDDNDDEDVDSAAENEKPAKDAAKETAAVAGDDDDEDEDDDDGNANSNGEDDDGVPESNADKLVAA